MLREAREELDFDIEEAKNDFSLLLLAIGQKNIKFYLGWSKRVPETNQTKSISLEEVSLESPVPDSHLQNLHDLLSWIYGEGKKIHRVINESRDITNYLSTVVASPEAIKYLKQTRNLKEAYELTDGEEIMVQKLLKKANIKLEKALGIVHRHKTPDVISEAEKCYETSVQIVKAVKE